MLLSLLLFAFFVGCGTVLWFHGFWSNIITLINVLISGMVAMNFFEPLTVALDEQMENGAYTYLIDFIILWGLFAMTFIILRTTTDLLSRNPVRFAMPIEMAGRSITAIWIAWVLLSFAATSLHTAPLPASPLGGWTTPQSGCFLGLAPDRHWLAFIQSRSRGALSRGDNESDSPHEMDQGRRVFDPDSEFIVMYQRRRAKYETEEACLVG